MNHTFAHTCPTDTFLAANPKIMGSFKMKVIIKSDYKRVDGTHALYLQLFITKQQLRLPLHIYVKAKEFDKNQGYVKLNCPYHNEYNIRIGQYHRAAQNIFNHYSETGRKLNKELFKREFYNYAQNENFLHYFQQKILLRTGVLNNSTIKQQQSTLNKLKEFNPDISFYELTPSLIEGFHQFLALKKGNGTNTILTAMKNLKVYTSLAIRDGKIKESPFKNYKIKRTRGRITFLTKDELKKLMDLYDGSFTNDRLKSTLQPFLFSCFTGLRISDIWNLQRVNVAGDILSVYMKKTGELATFPLAKHALHYINEGNGPLFNLISQQKTNKYLKECCTVCGINKRISFHIARHTFATLALRDGVKVEQLQSLLGHKSIRETMIYSHINGEDRAKAIDIINNRQW